MALLQGNFIPVCPVFFSCPAAERALTCVNLSDWPLCRIRKTGAACWQPAGATWQARRVPSLSDRLAHLGANPANKVEDKNDSY
jgi:hypothetical protein